MSNNGTIPIEKLIPFKPGIGMEGAKKFLTYEVAEVENPETGAAFLLVLPIEYPPERHKNKKGKE